LASGFCGQRLTPLGWDTVIEIHTRSLLLFSFSTIQYEQDNLKHLSTITCFIETNRIIVDCRSGLGADQLARNSPTSTEAELRGTFSEEALKQLSHQLAASGVLPSAASSPSSWIPGKDWLLMSALFQQQQQQRMREATMAAMQACHGDMSSCWTALMQQQQQQVNQPQQAGVASYPGKT
jgi:hypothetical protein